MSVGKRLLKIAQRRMMEGLGLVQGAGFQDARQELDDFLRGPGASRPSSSSSGANGGYSRPSRPTSPPPNPYEADYRLLGAPVGSDLQTVQRCWRQRVRENHPDQFASNPEEQRRATERLRRINEAHDRLLTHLR